MPCIAEGVSGWVTDSFCLNSALWGGKGTRLCSENVVVSHGKPEPTGSRTDGRNFLLFHTLRCSRLDKIGFRSSERRSPSIRSVLPMRVLVVATWYRCILLGAAGNDEC